MKIGIAALASLILNLSRSGLVQGHLFSFTVQLRTQAVLL